MASDRHMVNAAEELTATLNALHSEFDHGLLARIQEASAGVTATRVDGSGSSGSAYADPTPNQALRGLDTASRDRIELERAIGRALTAIRRAWDIARRYPEPHIASADDRAELERLDGIRSDGCASCARIADSHGLPRWEPVDSRRIGPTTVNGRLEVKAHLCRWCTDRVAMWGRWPTLFELEDHHAGKRVPWPADVERRR